MRSPQSLNHTFITLVPKKNSSPKKITDFRPMSLCNVMYKLISKVIANRLKGILNDVVSKPQSAFVPGCLITDNVLIAYKLILYLKQRRVGTKGYMSVKVDISKMGFSGNSFALFGI